MEFFHKPNIDFIKHRRIPIAISLAIILGGIAVIAFKGFNYSIEFTGGTALQVSFPKHIPLADMGGKPGGRAPALHVYDHRGDLRHDGIAKRFLHQGKAGAAGGGH